MPAWLRYPDRERVGWVNDILSQLWPQVAAAAAVMVRTRVSLLVSAGPATGLHLRQGTSLQVCASLWVSTVTDRYLSSCTVCSHLVPTVQHSPNSFGAWLFGICLLQAGMRAYSGTAACSTPCSMGPGSGRVSPRLARAQVRETCL